MCTLLLAYRAHPAYRLVIAANRDEYYQRPTEPARFWEDAPHIFAGRDLVHGGTWLGVTATGRIAALTNYRDPGDPHRHGPSSRGRLVSGFLAEEAGAEEYLARLRESGIAYGGYNLLVGDSERLLCYSNKSDRVLPIEPGIHGLSNHLLDTPWPKVRCGKDGLARLLSRGHVEPEELFALLADETHPADQELPDTGVGLELERMLSPIFIRSAQYGTRSSTVLLVDHEGKAVFIERGFDGGMVRERRAEFQW
ncbi:NRDE family protein [Geomonas nitrogeniifigens]|uniref:NRDE family protein n=1 Tax=Geomonas diazotrophica TaxID=2843197 RepID=UPI001C2BBAB4|nr:NRDE family protein [Geomonas nitrogeniifigens]QXE87300.1 NRDE family protein [Geomonas nitrogeniifigens]